LTLVVLPLLYILFSKGGRLRKRGGEGFAAAVAVAGLLFFSQNTLAQTPMTLDEAVAKARADNLQIKAGTLEVQARQALRGTAYELPKTNFDLQMGQYNSNRFDQSINIRQEIPNPRNKRAGIALNDANVRSAQLSLTVTQQELTREVRSAWYELAYLLERQRLLQTQDSLLNQFVQAAELRLKTGETGGLERATAVSQSEELKSQLAQTQGDIAIAQSRLQTLLAATQPVSIPANTRLEKRLLLPSGDISGSPVLAWYQHQIAVSKALVGVEKAKLSPDFSIGYLNQSLTTPDGVEPGYNSLDRFHVVQAGIAVTIFGKAQKARIESAQLQQQVAQANAEVQSALLASELRQALQAYEKQQQALVYYEQTALPTADYLLSTAQTAFGAGDIGYVEFVQALTRANDIRLDYLEAVNQYNQEVIQYQYLVNQ
jgi:cobalt-zinc-cadmium resistance protein CzcA